MAWSRQRDEDFAEFAAKVLPLLHRRAYLLTASKQNAEDLTQTALAKAYLSWSRVESADDPVAYVHGILLKSFLSVRRRRSSSEVPMADPSQAADSPLTGHAPDQAVDRLVLLTALRNLSAVDRAVVVLRYWEDRSVEQTANSLDLSSAAVRNRSMRALAQLRGALATSPTSPESARKGKA